MNPFRALRSLALIPLLAGVSGNFAQVARASVATVSAAPETAPDFLAALGAAPCRVIAGDGTTVPESAVKLDRVWSGDLCRSTLTNTSDKPVVVADIVLFDFAHGLPGTTPLYGECFQKLGQLGGTLEKPRDLGAYSDRGHYKIPEPEGLRTAYGMLTLQPAGADRLLLAFTSSNRFVTRFSFDGKRLRISLDGEKLTLAPGETWKLEEFLAIASPDREKLYDRLTAAIAVNHPRLRHDPEPTGWCSWVCFGPGVTAKNVSDTTGWIAKNLPALRYIQIDDGYQPWMGDWLEHGKAFGGGVDKVLDEIKAKGLEPAIWVAPFIASPQSKVFHDHPDWFVTGDDGKPLRSDKVGFGGWRQGPWYVLDGTNPAAQRHLTEVFRTMREQWGVTYFKLDANYWGAMHGGHHFDPKATRVEAYRRGMAAILKGAGDAFILGCNHPVWPSLGLINGSRSSMDISPNWNSFRSIGRENLLRDWQNGRLWWNDPDCILLNDGGSKDVMDAGGVPVTSGVLPENEYIFHATVIYATGGMVLSGDDLTKITPHRVEILKKLLPPIGVCAAFENEAFEVGVTTLKDRRMVSVFNWGDKPVTRRFALPAGKSRLTDYWTGADLGVHEGEYVIDALPGRSAKLISVTPAP